MVSRREIRRILEGVQDRIADRLVHRSIFNLRYQNGEVRRIIRFLDQHVFGPLIAELERRLHNISSRGYDTVPANVTRLAQMLAALDELIVKGFRTSYQDLAKNLTLFAKLETDFGITILDKNVPFPHSWAVPTQSQLKAIVMARPMQGRLLKDWYSGLADSTRIGVRRAIQIGMTEGRTLEEIVRSIRGTSRNNYTDGVLAASRRQVEAVVRTAVNHTQAYAREDTYKANDDLIEGVRYVATLDSRTTIICASLDGKVFAIGEGPRPPQHMNCRSTTIPVMKEVSAYANIPPATRAALGGPVAGDLTYENWLRRQSTKTQNDVLGAKRAALFRSGEPIGSFVNNHNQVLTLAQLRSKGLDV